MGYKVGLGADFEVCNLVGVFYEHGDRLYVADEHDGTVDVEEALSAVRGRGVHVAAHHRPPEPPQGDRWGGGCCHYEGTGQCPAGHHDRPQWIYTFQATGVLQIGPEIWSIRPMSETGSDLKIRTDWLVGHRSQLVVMSMPDFEGIQRRIRELDPANLQDARVADLQARAHEIQAYLSEIQRLKDKIP